ncbi:lipocalin [Aquimarina sp. W85]|uniref:lipocalin n=1 Tax=Aquimarina rhodophyticola TaxID=3342246 RepID=UPI00366F1B37
MKNILLLLVTLAVVSCSPTKRTIISAKKTLKGSWSLDNISYSRSGVFEVTLYDDASAECLTGSTWRFIPNNNTGTYDVNRDACVQMGARNFRWTIPTPDESGVYSFMFKPINEKKKSTNDNKGYRMTLESLDETTMTWTQTVSLEGKPFVITMNFNKLQQ